MSASDQSYWTVTWIQLRKKSLAMFGFYFVVFLVYLATYAPYFSSSVPFYISGGESWPFFKELFNTNRFESGVDIAFNLFSFFLIPLTLLSWMLRKRVRNLKYLWLGSMSLFVILFFVLMGPGKVQKPYVDYIELYWGSEGVQFPINPFHFDPNEISANQKSPGYVDSFGRTFYLGTDDKSRDVLALLLYGTRISLTIGVVAVGIYVSIGIVLGALAGYFGGRVDILISRLIEVMICFPTFLLIMTLVAFIEDRSIFHVMIVIGITGWTRVARLVRAEFLKQRQLDFVVAAQALGGKAKRIIFRHVLPNSLGPVLVSAALGVPAAIIVESGLSFLGLGDVNSPSWGQVLMAGRNTNLLPWLIHPPGIAIFLTVSAMNLLGDGLRDALDPKLRGR